MFNSEIYNSENNIADNYATEKDNVLVVGSVQSYLPHSVIANLEQRDISILFSNGDMETISYSGIKFSAILIFVDEELLLGQQFLVYLKDIAVEADIPVFMIGYPDDCAEMSKIIPSYLIQKLFIRPINAGQVVNDMVAFLNEHDVRNRKKILVVDDSATTLRSLRTLLSAKYQVILAGSGAMAFKYLAQDHPDLILLDYEMPIIDGKQLLEMIRSEAEFASTPVIFLTARGDRESIMNVMHLKPEGYLLKTMDLKMVENAIDEFFEKQKAMKKI